jgi:hypothetical protein
MLHRQAAGSRQPAEKILLIRSGRHLRVALEALRAWSPGCEVGVIGTAGSEGPIATAGIPPYDAFIYTKRARLQPISFFFSLTALRARHWGYDRIAILWNDPDGTGQGNVDRTALAMSPRGYLAITPDGTIVERSLGPQLRTECLRVVMSLGTAAILGALLYVPAAITSFVRAGLKAGPYRP